MILHQLYSRNRPWSCRQDRYCSTSFQAKTRWKYEQWRTWRQPMLSVSIFPKMVIGVLTERQGKFIEQISSKVTSFGVRCAQHVHEVLAQHHAIASRMSRDCFANVTRLLRECRTLQMRNIYEGSARHMRGIPAGFRVRYALLAHLSSTWHACIPRKCCAHLTREMRPRKGVTFGHICIPDFPLSSRLYLPTPMIINQPTDRETQFILQVYAGGDIRVQKPRISCTFLMITLQTNHVNMLAYFLLQSFITVAYARP
jgi:hypothetical protein